MTIFPAIDLSEGKVVRLRQGDFKQKKIYQSDPLVTAQSFEEQGASHLHIVDLDGAKGGVPANFSLIEKIAKKTKLSIQMGGGIRNEQRANDYFSAGVARVIIGTAAVSDPRFLEEMISKHKNQIAVGVDARNGYVAVQGWLQTTKLFAVSFCASLFDKGVKTIVYTDIARDGLLEGSNLPLYQMLCENAKGSVIASGGVSSLDDVKALKKAGVAGMIVGKALYEGKLTIPSLLREVEANAD